MAPTEAQSGTPLLVRGTVYDTGGSAVGSGVKVVVRDMDTGAWLGNVTNASGGYKVTFGDPDGRPWMDFNTGDTLKITAYDNGQKGVNTTIMDAGAGTNWLNVTLGTPSTTKTIDEPKHSKYTYDNGSANEGYLVYEEVNVTSPTARLSFQTLWQIESRAPSEYDQMEIYLSPTHGESGTQQLVDVLNPNTDPAQGGPYSYYSSAGFNTPPTWQQHEYWIDDYVDVPCNVTVTFNFTTGDDVQNYWEGWLIDDVTIGDFTDDVESGTGNWTYTGMWHISDHRSNSDDHAWYYGMEHSYVTEETLFTMTPDGGYNYINYTIRNGTYSSDWQNYSETGPFTFDDVLPSGYSDCWYNLAFRAENESNSEPWNEQAHCLDTTAPTTSYEFDRPSHNFMGKQAVSTATTMWINASDVENTPCGAGVKWLNYTVGWNETATNPPEEFPQLVDEQSVRDNSERDLDKREGYISVALTFEEECWHEVKYSAVDYLGHGSGQTSIDIAVDGTAPSRRLTVGDPSYTDEQGWRWVNCSTNVTVHVTDDGCAGGVGVETLRIEVFWNETRLNETELEQNPDGQELYNINTIEVTDGGPLDLDNETNGEILYNLSFDRNCFHEPEFWIYDYVGNYDRPKSKFMVDCTPPAIRKDIPKITKLKQTEMDNFTWLNWTGGDDQDQQVSQSFLAPWSYLDAVSVYLNGTVQEDAYIEVWDSLDDEGPIATTEDIPTGDYSGWVQLHFNDRVWTEHDERYWLRLNTGQYAPLMWNASDGNPYPDGNVSINGVWHDDLDMMFKIEYYPVHPYVPGEMFAEYNETGDYDHLHESHVTTEAFLNLSSWDEGCMGGVGLDTLEYRVWWNGTWTEWMNYTEPFNFTEECVHYVEINATDILGNTRIINQTHYVDDSPPEVRLEYPDRHGYYMDTDAGKMYVRAGKPFYLNLTDMPEEPCGVGVNEESFTFYWRFTYDGPNTTTTEKHPKNDTDDTYSYPIEEINGEYWYVVTPGQTEHPLSVELSFSEACNHTFYYFYEASDLLDNDITSDVESETIYVDDGYPEVTKEYPPCYTNEEWMYLHSESQSMPDTWQQPDYSVWIGDVFWTELSPDKGRIYEGVYDDARFTASGYIDTNENGRPDHCDYIELTDAKYDVNRLYHIENVTATLELYNETDEETIYVDFESFSDRPWPADSNFDKIQEDPIGSLWREVYPDHNGSLYNVTDWETEGGLDSAMLTMNNTNTGVTKNWTVMVSSWDLIVDPVPFVQACGRFDLSAQDMPDKLEAVDQAQDIHMNSDVIQPPHDWPWDAQSFKPTVDNVNATNLYLEWNQECNVTVYIRDAAENILAEKKVHLTGTSNGEWVPFNFTTGISVVPDTTYYIEAQVDAGQNGSALWYYATGDPYTRGHAWQSGDKENTLDQTFQIISWRENPCASGIEGKYFGYMFNGTYHPTGMEDNTSKYGQVVDITQYYSDEEIRANFTVDGEPRDLWYVYDEDLGVHFHEECIHWLYYWAKDNVCHHTDVYEQVYHIDEYRPTVDKGHPEHGYSAPVEISVEEAFENYTDNVQYEGEFHVRNNWTYEGYDDGWLPYPPGQYVTKNQTISFTVSNNDLNHGLVLTVSIEEVVGDEGISLADGENLDSTEFTIEVPPGGSETVEIPVYDNKPFLEWGVWQWEVTNIENVTQYLRAGAEIDLTAEDPGYCASGVENIYYRYEWNDSQYPMDLEAGVVDGSTLSDVPAIANHYWYIYDGAISFDEECVHDLYYFAKDRSCHNSTLHHQTYYVDDSPPVVEEELPDHGAVGRTTQSLYEDFNVPFTDWTTVVNDGYWKRISNWWPRDDNYPRSGRYCAHGQGDDAWLISPEVAVPEDGNLSFYYRGDGTLTVGVSNSSDRTDTSYYTDMWTSSFIDDQYRRVEVDLSAYAGDDVYIGFHVTAGYVYLDDVWVGGIDSIATPFEDDMENTTTTMDNWTTNDLTAPDSFWKSVGRVPVYETSPPAPSMWCGDLSLPNGEHGIGRYGCNWNDTLTLTEPINLSDVDPSDSVYLDFWFWLNSEFPQDKFYVEITNDSSDWANASEWVYDTGDFPWTEQNLLISNFIGNETVYIRFRFVSNDIYTADNGVFLDNVSIYNSTYDFLNESNYTTSPTMDTFDDPWANWTARMLDTSQWHLTDYDSQSGDCSSWWNGDETDNEYRNCTNGTLVTNETIDLAGYAGEGYEAMLTFWHEYDMHDDLDDTAYVEVSADGGTTWTELAMYDDARTWTQEFIDITPYIGETIHLRFRFKSDRYTVDPGWYVDDVKVEVRNITGTAFEDDFERTFPPAGWTEQSNGNYSTDAPDYKSWERWADDHVASIVPWEETQEAWLISPHIENLPKFSNLTFYNDFNTDIGTGRVMISTTGTDPADFTTIWTASDLSSGTVDISLWDYKDEDIYLAFVYNSSAGEGYDGEGTCDEYWSIDDVEVTSLGFLREGAPIHLKAYDQPVDSDCDAGVSALYWRYAYDGDEYRGWGDKYVNWDEIDGITEDDTGIYGHHWYKIVDNGEYDTDDRQGYISVNVSFQEECIHDIYYFAKDTLCHTGELHNETYYVDGTAPDTYMGVSWGDHPWIPKNDKFVEYQLTNRSGSSGDPAPQAKTQIRHEDGKYIWDIYLMDASYDHTEFQLVISETAMGPPDFHVGWLSGSFKGMKEYNGGGWGSQQPLPGDITVTGSTGDKHFHVEIPEGMYLYNGDFHWSLMVGATRPGEPDWGSHSKFAIYPGNWSTWAGEGYYAPAPTEEDMWNYMYHPDGYKPSIICINDDFHFKAEHPGTEPCIYPYNQQENTYYRWQVKNETGAWVDAWPTEQNYTDEMEGVVWGNDLNISNETIYKDHVKWHYWMNGQGPDYFNEGCEHRLVYFSKDDLCNTEKPNYWEVGVDDEPPETNITFSGDESHYFQASENLYYMQNDTQICLNASDMPENENCSTGVQYINYTVWRWVTTTYDVKVSSKYIQSWAPVYDADTDGNIGDYYDAVDSDNSETITAGDYLDIAWGSGYSGRKDGWYLIKDITKVDGKYLLNVQDATENASGHWESVIPWQRTQDGVSRICFNGEGLIFDECGKYEIHYYAVDYNNMTEEMHVPDIMVDCTPPHSTKTFGQPVLQTEIEGGETVHVVNGTTKICFSAVDPRLWDSGVKDIRYKFEAKTGIGEPAFWEWHTFENVSEGEKYCFTLKELFGQEFLDTWYAEHGTGPDPAGLGTDEPFILYHHAIDNVSHEEAWLPTKQKIYYNPYLNETAPNITKGYEEPNIASEVQPDLHYITSDDTNIWLHGTDKQGGLVEMQVAILSTGGEDPYPDEGDWWTAWSSETGTGEANITFTIAEYESDMGELDDTKEYYLFYRAVDQAGLMSDEGKQRFRLDDTAPTTDIEELGDYTYGDKITVNVTAQDNFDIVNVSSVTLYYRYRPNETAEWGSWTACSTKTEAPYTWQFNPPEPGYYEFYARATDGLGNEGDAPVGDVAQAESYVEPVAGDFNGDGEVDMADLMKIAKYWQVEEGDPEWSDAEQYDLNDDGEIDLSDLSILASNWTG